MTITVQITKVTGGYTIEIPESELQAVASTPRQAVASGGRVSGESVGSGEMRGGPMRSDRDYATNPCKVIVIVTP